MNTAAPSRPTSDDPPAVLPEPAPGAVEAGRPTTNPLRWGLAALLVSLAVVLLALTLAMVTAYRSGRQALDNFGDLFGRSQPTPVLFTQAVVLRQLQGASELATALFTMETVVTESQDRTLGELVIGQTRLLYVAHGQVRAGVDLAALDVQSVDVGENRVTVRLPPPEILDKKIDVERSYVYDIQRSLLGPVDPDLQSRAERYALDRILRGACEGGILEEANARAELTVRMLLESAGSREVRVEAQSPTPGSCVPPSTQPPPP